MSKEAAGSEATGKAPAHAAAPQAEEEPSHGARVRNAIAWAVVLALLAAAIAFVVLRLLYPPRIVETGSMRPEYPVGTIVFIDEHAYDAADPQVGDVAVYDAGDREVMHRIVRVNDDGTYVFKGDNSASEDFSPVARGQIVGREAFHLSWIAPLVRQVRGLSEL